MRTKPWLPLIFVLLALSGCGYRYFAEDLRPLSETEQASTMKVSDDGTVTYVHQRLEISLRPMTDGELNRQFPRSSQGGAKSTNPFTYGDWKPWGADWTPERFTVFYLKIKNYTYPKMQVDPFRAMLVAQNGREYAPLSQLQLEEYYYPYVVGYTGTAYERFKQRTDILKATLYQVEPVFSGQEREGYVVFPKLHHDVQKIAVHLNEIILRFNVMNEPLETVDVVFRFHRDVYKARQPRS